MSKIKIVAQKSEKKPWNQDIGPEIRKLLSGSKFDLEI